ncbi:MAG TPA: phosphohistidine phosphatase SixA [Burkholderiales bacterium]|nr:phosphohistidine phosphatase SixA [Burkholderiales bacterium]
MDLILWRHADAEDGTLDLQRALTRKGEKQAMHMAQWLSAHLPSHTRIVVSPALRAQQTARALARAFETVPALAPGAPYTNVLSAANWPQGHGAVVVVGHQPTLGQVAALLLSGEPAFWTIKKGAIFWLTHRSRAAEPQVALRAALSPELL